MSNDWTNKLRDQLADYQEPVSHDLWAEIEQSLAQSKKVGDEETDVKKRPQTRYVVLKRWSVAAAIALLGCLFVLFFHLCINSIYHYKCHYYLFDKFESIYHFHHILPNILFPFLLMVLY